MPNNMTNVLVRIGNGPIPVGLDVLQVGQAVFDKLDHGEVVGTGSGVPAALGRQVVFLTEAIAGLSPPTELNAFTDDNGKDYKLFSTETSPTQFLLFVS